MKVGIKVTYSRDSKPSRAPLAISQIESPIKLFKKLDNLGNRVFCHGAYGLFSEKETEFVPFYYDDDPQLINKLCDILVFPEANFINPNLNYGEPANFVRQITKPSLLIGAGSQAKIEGSNNALKPSEFKIPAATIEFIKHFTQFGNILVRGNYTKSVLENNGIKDVTASGCPSYTINPSKNLWQKIVVKSRSNIKSFIITEGLYHNLGKSPMHNRIEKFLLESALMNGQKYVGQFNASVMAIALGMDNDETDSFYKDIKKRYFPRLSIQKIKSMCESSFEAYTDVETWINKSKQASFSIGSRFHGNMVPLQAGTPALPIIHDSRTKELCELLEIPSLTLEKCAHWMGVNDLLNESMVFNKLDHARIDLRRNEISNIYRDALINIGAVPSEKLNHLASRL